MPGNDRLLAAVRLVIAIAVLSGAGIFVYANTMTNMSRCSQMMSGMGIMGNMMRGSNMTPSQCQAMNQQDMNQCQNMMSSDAMAQCQAMMQQSSMTCN